MTTITPTFKHVAAGLRFPEGPVAMSDGSVVLVEIERRTLSRVAPDGKVTVIAQLGGGPNGAAMGPGGKIYVTNNGGLKFVERPGRLFPVAQADDYVRGSIQVVDLATGKPKINPSADYTKGRPVIVFPSGAGGHNFNPMSLSAKTGLVYIPAIHSGMMLAPPAIPATPTPLFVRAPTMPDTCVL